MPKTKPQPDQAGRQAADRLGRRSPAPTTRRPSCRRSSSSCATRRSSSASAPRRRRACCSTARPAPARRCWPRPSPTSRAPSSSRSRPRRSSRCSPASAPRASAACSARRARPRPRSSSSTSSTPSAPAAARDNNSEREQTLNQLLVEMDGFPDSDRIVVMAASNLLEKLDPALLRPGRFDRQVFVSPPDVNGRRAILEVHTRNKPLRDVDLDLVARQTSGLTGADLANIANEAAIRCARRKGIALVPGRLREGARARRRRRRVLARADRPRAAHRRLPRGRPRAVRRAAAGRRPPAQGLDRPARQRARASRCRCPTRTATSRRARTSSTA